MRKKAEKFWQLPNCPVRTIMDRFGDKWSVLVIIILGSEGTMRFNELSNTIGDVSQKMLTVTLRTLEADGLVSRKTYPEIPPRVEYKLTAMGESLLPHIDGLAGWAFANMKQITQHREKQLKKQLSAAK
ncbi:MAG TPA: helix-turn-helix domain-containing protein [Chitinophaga sp.]|uniref:winged helix-turn-helix transcriptional regulator n=1 Tax=Chitinophaga sp. TaxID=1869181 RepID=UPI002CD66311|nr:helix-turn-helix domain-containing protein [Chitinophaga sp.]HVI46699.1 helix-turn-helix domain-containing protein [Chitinophaga sp.]